MKQSNTVLSLLFRFIYTVCVSAPLLERTSIHKRLAILYGISIMHKAEIIKIF